MDWVKKVTEILVNIDGKLRVDICMESLLSYSKVLSYKLSIHLHLFLKTRLPLAKAKVASRLTLGLGFIER